MVKGLQRLLFFLLMLLLSPQIVAVQGGPELDRSLVSMYGSGEGELWIQGDYVNGSFAEQLGYKSTTSGINYSQALTVGGKYGVSDALNLTARYGQYEDEAWRTSEPKLVRSQYSSVESVIQHLFYSGGRFDLAWSLGYRSHSARDGELRRFEFGEYLIDARENSLSVSGLAEVTNTTLRADFGGQQYTLEPVSDSIVELNSSYRVSQLQGEQFQVVSNGKTTTVKDNSNSLTVTTPGGASATIAPYSHDEKKGVIELTTNFRGNEVTRYLQQGSAAEEVQVYTSTELINPIVIKDQNIPGTDVDSGDLITLLEVENSLGLLALPKAADTVSDISRTLAVLDTSYIVRAEPSDESISLGLTGAWYPDDRYRFTFGSELRRIHIDPNYRINPGITSLLEIYKQIGLDGRGEEALKLINDQLPQEEAWRENHLLLMIGADWDAYEDLSFAAQYSYYNISRDGYQSTKGKVNRSVEDQTTNHQLDGWIFVKPSRDLTFYLHGRAYSNFLLGDRPLLYNARVNHRFTDPYGYISIGAVWEF